MLEKLIEIRNQMDETVYSTMSICIYALVIMLVCWIMAKIIDRKCKNQSNVKGTFSEKHPRLNLIVGLCMLTIIGGVVWGILYCFGLGIKSSIGWITYRASKMDAVVIVGLMTGMVSIVGVIISSVVAKIIDYRKNRQDYLAKKREEPYGEFVEMIYKVQQNANNKNNYTEQMMMDDLSGFSKQITLWGSSNVVNKWVRFRENGANPDASMDNLFLMEEIMNEMRKDLGLKKIKKGNLLAFFVNDIKETMKAIKH